jgi:hypothetical protein
MDKGDRMLAKTQKYETNPNSPPYPRAVNHLPEKNEPDPTLDTPFSKRYHPFL